MDGACKKAQSDHTQLLESQMIEEVQQAGRAAAAYDLDRVLLHLHEANRLAGLWVQTDAGQLAHPHEELNHPPGYGHGV